MRSAVRVDGFGLARGPLPAGLMLLVASVCLACPDGVPDDPLDLGADGAVDGGETPLIDDDDSGEPDADAEPGSEVTVSVAFERGPAIRAWAAQPGPPVPPGQPLMVRVSAVPPDDPSDELVVTAAVLRAGDAVLTVEALPLGGDGQHAGVIAAPSEPGVYWLEVRVSHPAGPATTDRTALTVVGEPSR